MDLTDLLVTSRDIVKDDHTLRWPGWRRNIPFLWFVLRHGVRSKRPDPRYGANVGLQVGPEHQQELEVLAEENDIDKGHTDHP